MPSNKSIDRRPRLGGRSARVVQDVLNATLEQLATVGFNALSIEEIAVRAGVNKTTVYRRWQSKTELVRAALLSRSDEPKDTTSAGTLRADLLLLGQNMQARLASPQGQCIVRMLLSERVDDPEVSALMRSLRSTKMPAHVAMIEAAVARGEVPEGTDASLIVEAVIASLFYRVYVRREEFDSATLQGVVDLVIEGAAHGGAATARPVAAAPPATARSPRRARATSR